MKEETPFFDLKEFPPDSLASECQSSHLHLVCDLLLMYLSEEEAEEEKGVKKKPHQLLPTRKGLKLLKNACEVVAAIT